MSPLFFIFFFNVSFLLVILPDSNDVFSSSYGQIGLISSDPDSYPHFLQFPLFRSYFRWFSQKLYFLKLGLVYFQAFSLFSTPSFCSRGLLPTKVYFSSGLELLYSPIIFHYFSSCLVHGIKSWSRSKCLHSNYLYFPVFILGFSLLMCVCWFRRPYNPFRGTS